MSAKHRKRKVTKAKVRIVDNPNSIDGIEQYVHPDKKRPYNPPVGLVTPETDKEMPTTKYAYDPYLDPQLQWAGKAEHTRIEVDTVSLHVHERIDPLTIIEKVVKRESGPTQMSLFRYFESPENNPPLREAIHFYKHSQNWSNRLIAGDSLLVMNSLLQKESMTGKVQMIYIDPPYGVRYGSNFQPFVNRREVKDGSDGDLTQEPEMVKAFRDTWELGIHSYLSYLRDRLLLARELLSATGSIFVQISDENLHHVREILDEVFGSDNFVATIAFKKTGSLTSKKLSVTSDYILWYAKNQSEMKFHPLLQNRIEVEGGLDSFRYVLLENGEVKTLSQFGGDPRNLPKGAKLCQSVSLTSQHFSSTRSVPFMFRGKKFEPPTNRQWSVGLDGLERLAKAGRVFQVGENLRFAYLLDDNPYTPITNVWTDTGTGSFTEPQIFVVETSPKVVSRCVLLTTDPGDLIFDPTCGSGTTAHVAEKWGRRWIACDTSRVAIALAKQRLLTSTYDFYELAHPNEGVSSGFIYETASHIGLSSVANDEPGPKEVLYDRPKIDHSKKRIAGPFTIEAVPSQRVFSLEEDANLQQEADLSIARSGETVQMTDWINELHVTGIRGRQGKKIEFARLEPLGATRYLHAEGETRDVEPKRIVVSFGSAYAPLDKAQVERAIEEAQKLVPKPRIIVFAAFQFDPEAARNIDETEWPGVMLLKVQMNTDLFTEDLKKKRSSNESFWLVGQPDIELGEKGKNYVVKVNGFDYYNPVSGDIESGDISKIAMWMLDTDYDGRSLYPRQIFFPMADQSEGWGKLAKNLKAELDEEVLDKLFKGETSLPFELGDKKRVAVKIIDDRGIESMRIIEVKG